MSHQTADRWSEEIGKSIKKDLESKAANFKFCSLVIDETTDTTDMTHLAIFIRGADDKYIVTEEMAYLVPLKDTLNLWWCNYHQ